MSTTIGIGNIVSPVVAIGFGGPGALLGFVLATLFGGASTYTEVALSLSYRKRYKDGSVSGGPMQYLGVALHPIFSYLYAGLGVILLVAWSSNQSNQLAVLLEPWHLSHSFVGASCAALILFMVIGGIKRVSNVAEKLVPAMFFLYTAAMLWILFVNVSELPGVLWLVLTSAFSPQAVGGATIGVGLQRALRWGLAKGFQSNESGIGTASIAHTVADTEKPTDQAALALVSVYTNGILCILSGLAVLVTGVWKDPTLPFDITMVDRAISLHFSQIGSTILMLSGVLFSLTTILGNSYYGTRCFLFVTNNRWLPFHHILVGLFIFAGTAMDVKFLWSVVDFFVIPVAVPHIIGIVVLAFRKRHLLKPT